MSSKRKTGSIYANLERFEKAQPFCDIEVIDFFAVGSP